MTPLSVDFDSIFFYWDDWSIFIATEVDKFKTYSKHGEMSKNENDLQSPTYFFPCNGPAL